MNGAIFYSTRYGSTEQYAQWISKETGLSIYDVQSGQADPANFDFLVLGCPVIYHKLAIRQWIRRHLARIENKPIMMFTVSGAGAGKKLDHWIADSLPERFVSHIDHVALRGRQNPKDLTIFDRIMLIIGGLKNPDPVARREEIKGFDYMDRSSIEPVVAWVKSRAQN